MKKYMVSQFTPMNKNVPNWGKWTIMQCIQTLPVGMHKTIDGKECYLNSAIMAWEHVPGVPYFNTQLECLHCLLDLQNMEREVTE